MEERCSFVEKGDGLADDRDDRDRRSVDRKSLKELEGWVNTHTVEIASLTSNNVWIKQKLEEIGLLVSNVGDRIIRVEEYMNRGVAVDLEQIKLQLKESREQRQERESQQKNRVVMISGLIIALVVGIGGWFF